MKIDFFRGSIPVLDKKGGRLWWAEAGNDFWMIQEGSDDVIKALELPKAVYVERIAELELPEMDAEGIEIIITNILSGGYLEKPGIKNCGEAVLFVLVNEAIQRLSEIEKEEASS